jgi:hypothetical protein
VVRKVIDGAACRIWCLFNIQPQTWEVNETELYDHIYASQNSAFSYRLSDRACGV